MADGITFTGGTLDRVAERRGDPAWLAAQAADPAARAVLAGDDGIHVTGSGSRGSRSCRWPRSTLPSRCCSDSTPTARCSRSRAARPATAGRCSGCAPPRPRLGAEDAGLAAYAAALLNWHRRHRHCSVCGGPTAVTEGGIVRRCERCGAQHHPRTDPVVIMLVTDGDRVLLGRQRVWPDGRYSALAGFVEPGRASRKRSRARSARRPASRSARRSTSRRSRGPSRCR